MIIRPVVVPNPILKKGMLMYKMLLVALILTSSVTQAESVSPIDFTGYTLVSSGTVSPIDVETPMEIFIFPYLNSEIIKPVLCGEETCYQIHTFWRHTDPEKKMYYHIGVLHTEHEMQQIKNRSIPDDNNHSATGMYLFGFIILIILINARVLAYTTKKKRT